MEDSTDSNDEAHAARSRQGDAERVLKLAVALATLVLMLAP